MKKQIMENVSVENTKVDLSKLVKKSLIDDNTLLQEIEELELDLKYAIDKNKKLEQEMADLRIKNATLYQREYRRIYDISMTTTDELNALKAYTCELEQKFHSKCDLLGQAQNDLAKYEYNTEVLQEEIKKWHGAYQKEVDLHSSLIKENQLLKKVLTGIIGPTLSDLQVIIKSISEEE